MMRLDGKKRFPADVLSSLPGSKNPFSASMRLIPIVRQGFKNCLTAPAGENG
jgi:hypothetical protein